MSKSTALKLWGIIAIILAALVIGIVLFPPKDPSPTEHSNQEPLSNGDSNLADREVDAVQSVPESVPELATGQAAAPSEPSVEEFSPPPPPPPVQMPEEEDTPKGPFAESADLRQQERIKIDPPMIEIGQAWINGEERSNFTMPVAGGVDLEIEVERFESIGEDAGMFIGSVRGRPGSQVNLSYRGSAEAGTIRIPTEDRLYQILPSESGSVVVQERELAAEETNSGQPPLDAKIPPAPNFTPPPPPSELLESRAEP